MDLIELNNLCYKYNTTTIFSDLNLKIDSETFLCIAGANNSGKTTLLKILSGQIFCAEIYFLDEELNNVNDLIENTSYVDKETIFYSKTVFDELSLITDDSYQIKNLLTKFELIKYINKSPNSLNKENMIILKIIISLIKNPKLILLDNVFSCFSKDKKKKFIEELYEYVSKNEIALILATNNINESIYFDELQIINKKTLSHEIEKSNLIIPFTFDLSEKLILYNLIQEEEYNMEKLVDKLC